MNTLHVFPLGQSALIVEVNTCEPERRRLESMGIVPGSEITVLSRGTGSVLLAVGAARIAIEPDVARAVYVL